MCGTVAMATEPQLMSDNVADRRSVGVDCLCVCECVCVGVLGVSADDKQSESQKGCKRHPNRDTAQPALPLSNSLSPSPFLSLSREIN